MLRPYIQSYTPGLRPASVTSLLLLPGEHRAPRAVQRHHREMVGIDHAERERLAGHPPRVGSEGERREGGERLAVSERARHEFGRRPRAVHAGAEKPPALLVESQDALTLQGRMLERFGPL